MTMQLVEEVKISRARPAADDRDEENQVQREEREKSIERGNEDREREGRGKQIGAKKEGDHKNEDRHRCERGE